MTWNENQTMASKRNLVLGAVRGYGFEQLRPFVVSLKRTNFNGDLVLLYNHLNSETLESLQSHGVKLVHFPYRGSGALNSWSRFWPQLQPLLRISPSEGLRRLVYKKILNLAFVRFVHTLEFLESHMGTYQNVLVTDVRDVIFQDNPFRDPLPGEIVAFLEAPHMVFGSEPLNDSWIKENYSAEILAGLTGRRISCCGTVMGTEEGMIKYLQAFLSEVRTLDSLNHGADTSIHNIIVSNMKEHVAVVDNLTGAVGTIGANAQTDLRFNDSDLIVQPDGRPVPVLHQYDRHPEIAAKLEANVAGIK